MTTCGTCQHWQLIDVTPIAEGQPPYLHLGRCRSGQVPGYASARRRCAEPFRCGVTTCHTPVATPRQYYATYARTPTMETPVPAYQPDPGLPEQLRAIFDAEDIGSAQPGLRDYLAHQIAYDAARSEIESFCVAEPGLLPVDARWWNTRQLEDTEQHPEDAAAQHGEVQRAVAYLDLRGLIERHPGNPHLVRIKDQAEVQA